MYWTRHQSKQENLMYLVMWGILFAAPLLSMYARLKSGDIIEFRWDEVLHVWMQFSGFLLLFLLHNFILAPLLVYRQRQGLYLGSVTVVIILFSVFQCTTQPSDLRHRRDIMDGRRPPHELMEHHRRAHMDEEEPPFRHDGPVAPRHPLPHNHSWVLDWHDIFSIITLILVLGMNLGVKFYFKTRGDQKKLVELEKENLQQQLEYLKYQINPHFFMNTLNNIHALVDIDPEKAKESIVELSKMMRFILYEGDKHGVPLSREFDFIRNYITLMRLRFTDKVKITVDLPDEAPDKTVPPLMLISFIENAFKHGISYQHPSFIDAKVTIGDGKLHFTCRNSKADRPNQEKGGVGLANVKQRLKLLYDNNFTLNIQDNPDTYHVELMIPLG